MAMEILAPVGNEKSLVAAVCSGADAVYFGAEQFNARRNAENFGDDSLKKSVEYCRYNGIKCYLTLNVLIKNSELKNAVNLAERAYKYGIDGIIVQDLGLANILHAKFPALPLHASTQMSVHSAAALPVLKELGFCRVVPAREMSRENLAHFCKEAKKSGIEVEVFVHGALCMCLSGQCYFSAHLGGRSANRGLCAGTCRLPFSAEKGGEYALSLKDLSLMNEINSLKEMGVTSLKIEGRMKGPEYVAAGVNALRQVIDNGFAETKDFELLEKVFSRSGFTDGYFNNRLGKEMFGIRTETDKLMTNDSLSKLHELYRKPKQRLPIDFEISILKGKKVKLYATHKENTVTVEGDIPEEAINCPTDSETVASALKKLGGTPYYTANIKISIDDKTVFPRSKLNALKNTAISALDKVRSTPPAIIKNEINLNLKPCRKNIKGYFLRFANSEQLIDFNDLKEIIQGYSLPAEEIIKQKSLNDIKGITNSPILPFAELPRGAENDTATEIMLDKLKSLGIEYAVCSNISAVYLAKEKGFKIFGGFGLNLYNSLSLNAAADLGIRKGVLSPELSISEMQNINILKFESYAYCYGRFPLMLTKNCPAKNGGGCKSSKKGCSITDRKGEVFPVVCRNGFSEILNSRPTDIADRVKSISADFGYLYFTAETKSEIEKTVTGFKNGKITSSPFTRGLSKNGVL